MSGTFHLCALKRPALASALILLTACLYAIPALAEEDLAPATQGSEEFQSFQTGTRFFDDAEIGGGLYFFRRYRTRYDVQSGFYETNLNHASLQAKAEFSSGFIGNILGFDFAVFASHDPFNKGAVDHEMGFVPWSDPWDPDWSKKNTKDDASIYRAALKAKAGPVWAQAGYYQPGGPGVLGVNWSFMPGTYRGFNVGADIEKLSIAFAWADQYKSPWYTTMHDFRKNDGETTVPWLWSIGASYAFEQGLTLELAYGASKNHLKNAHFKSRFARDLAGGSITVGYHLYAMDDSDDSGASANDNFDGIATQHFLFSHFSRALWLFRLEGIYTRALVENQYQQGQFAYRLTDRTGSSKGAYEAWWNARSDWNAHNEKAFYLGLERKLDDFMFIEGFYAGAGTAIGFDGKAYGTSEHFKEWAFTADLGYLHPSGPLKGSFAKLHYTEYRNGTNKPSWAPYKNGFQSEHDIVFQMGVVF